MTNDKTDILGEFGFELDAALFYDAIVKSTDDYVYIVNMKTDTSLVSENMVRDFQLPGRIVPGLVPLWGSLIHERGVSGLQQKERVRLGGMPRRPPEGPAGKSRHVCGYCDQFKPQRQGGLCYRSVYAAGM